MNTHTKYVFVGEIRKISVLFDWKNKTKPLSGTVN